MSFTERVAAYFKAHPDTWISSEILLQIGGRYAWRTRVSDCRKLGMVIDNRVRTVADGDKQYTVSEYRFVTAKSQAA